MRWYVLLSSSSIAAFFSQTALAADAPPNASAPASIPEIIVTARRSEESIQSVPVSIEAFSQNQLTERSVASAADLARISTGLVANPDSGNPGTTTFSVRGRGQQYGAASGSVETYFADVPLGGVFAMPAPPPQFFDIASFQVLKGPQGTLFGRNTTGGAVVIVPNAPQVGITEGYVRLQAGTYGNFQAEGAVNVPVVGDKVALRVAFFDWQRKGYMTTSPYTTTGATQLDAFTGEPLGKQRFNNVNTTQVRASLRIWPSDFFDNTTTVSYIHEKTRASSGAGLVITPTGPATSPYSTVIVSRPPTCGKYCTYLDTNLTKPGSDHLIVTNTSKITLTDNLDIKNIIGYINSKGMVNDAADVDGTNAYSGVRINLLVPTRKRKSQQFTEELQLQGKAGGDLLTYIVGGMYDKTWQPKGVDDINFYSAAQSLYFGFPVIAQKFQSTDITNKALYASGIVSPIENLKISGGFRRTWTDMKWQVGTVNSIGVLKLVDSPPSVTSTAQNFAGNTYDLGASYQATPDVMVYAGYKHGFKRGGFNPSNSNAKPFGPEQVDDYTIGLKSAFKFENVRGHFNVEFFYDNYKDMQTTYGTRDGAVSSTLTVNIPKVQYKGFDADFALYPTDWLDLNAGYSYNDAKIKKWMDPTALPGDPVRDLSVNPVPFNSKNKFTVSGRAHTQLPDDIGEIVLLASVTHQDHFYISATGNLNPAGSVRASGGFDSQNTKCAGGICSGTVPSNTLVDMRIELNKALGSRFDFAAGVTNLTNKKYYIGTTGTLSNGAEAFTYGAPRMWTFEISTKF